MLVVRLRELQRAARMAAAKAYFEHGLRKLGLASCVHDGSDPETCHCRDNCVCRYLECEHKPRLLSRFDLLDDAPYGQS